MAGSRAAENTGPRQGVREDVRVIAVLSMADNLPPQIVGQIGGLSAARPAVIDLGREPAGDGTFSGPGLSACLRLLLDNAKIEGVVLVLDENARFGEAELALLAAEGWRKPVVAHFVQERRESVAESGNVVSFARGRRRRTLRALSGMGIAVAASPAQAGAEMKRALERRSGESPRNGALMDFASAIRWVDQNVY